MQRSCRYPDPVANAFRIRAAEILGVQPDMVLCGNGSDDILTIVTRACVGQGQRLRLPYPSYVLYRTLAQLQGAEWEEVPFGKDWTLTSDFYRSDENLKLAFLPNPEQSVGDVHPAVPDPGIGRATAMSPAGRRSLRRVC